MHEMMIFKLNKAFKRKVTKQSELHNSDFNDHYYQIIKGKVQYLQINFKKNL